MSPRASNAASGIAWACVLIALGGVLLGVQFDRNSDVSGTGLVSFAVGSFVAVAAAFVRSQGLERMPRDVHAAFAVVFGVAGLATLAAAALAPGGPWMFLEVVVLLAAALRGRANERFLSRGVLVLLALAFLFRVWICYQGSLWRWQVLELDVPVLAWIPLDVLAPIQSVSLGSFTPHEMNFPPAGLAFGATLASWAIGFALVAGGLLWLQTAAREHENDRIHAVLMTLPPELASLVERLVPEEEWHALGLHGLSERRLMKRIEALVRERAQRQREIERALDALPRFATPQASFGAEITRALSERGQERT